MNIKRAKQEIKNTIEAYLMKDEYGEYVIPSDPSAAGAAAWARTGYRKDTDHGADRAGSAMWGWSPIQSRTIRDRVRSDLPFISRKRSLTAKTLFRDGIYDERDHRFGV